MKILIAEDDLHIREGLKDLLEAEGYECLLAANGEEALQLFNDTNPQLVLLDIMMPDKDGYSVCREIRRENTLVSIIFISAKSEEIDRVVGLELGADDYISKPFGKREVIARIRAVTRRYLHTNDSKKENIQFSDGLRVMSDELRAEREGSIIDLSLRDVKTLELLHQQKNKVVTKDQIFNHCWGRNYLPSSRTLDQHMSKLRKLIEIDPKKPSIIKTIHGVGYRYDE